MCLAEILVDKQATAITAAKITDTRGNTTLCGWVTGLIGTIDTTALFALYDATFNSWFNDAKDAYQSKQLRKYSYTRTTTGASESTFNVSTYIPEYHYSSDILEVYISGLRVKDTDYTQSGSTITLTTPITHAGTEITFVVLQNANNVDGTFVVHALDEYWNGDQFTAYTEESAEDIRQAIADGKAFVCKVHDSEDALYTVWESYCETDSEVQFNSSSMYCVLDAEGRDAQLRGGLQ